MFTAAGISKLKSPDVGRIEKYDAAVRGFGIRVTASGSRSWIFVYSYGGKRRRYTIGSVDVIPLAKARATAATLKDNVKAGGDPAGDKQQDRRQVKATAGDRSGNFGEVVEKYFARHAGKLARGWEMRQIIDRELMPHWRHRRMVDITRYDVAERVGVLMDAGKGGAANRLYECIRQTFNFAIQHAMVRGLESSPCDRMKAPAARVKRDRTLTMRCLLRTGSA